MTFAFVAYFIAFTITLFITKRKKIHYEDYPYLHLTKYGVIFYSKARHRLEIGQAKIIQVEKIVYLKTNSKMVVLKNVDEIIERDGYLYFKAQGKVSIIFNSKKIYRYFNINIISTKFDLSKMKRDAVLQVVNNLFNNMENKKLNDYIHCITNILNIEINSSGIKVKQNILKIPFSIIFKCNNKIKKINVNETF